MVIKQIFVCVYNFNIINPQLKFKINTHYSGVIVWACCDRTL